MQYSNFFYQTNSNLDAFEQVNGRRDYIRYYGLLYRDISATNEYAKTITKNYIAAISRSFTLAVRAIYSFLLLANSYDKKLFFLEAIDPLTLAEKVKSIACKFQGTRFDCGSVAGLKATNCFVRTEEFAL